jgi:hypothetical protein
MNDIYLQEIDEYLQDSNLMTTRRAAGFARGQPRAEPGRAANEAVRDSGRRRELWGIAG